MRLLYVDTYSQSLNPTQTLTPLLARAAVADTVFYGPGFSTSEELNEGLLRFCERNRPFDVLMLGPNTPIFDSSNTFENIRHLKRHSTTPADAQTIYRFLSDVAAALPQIDIKSKIISLLNYDYYSAPQQHFEVLLKLNLMILGPNDQFVSPLSELPAFSSQEKHFQRKQGRITDAWRDFVISNPQRVITATHFVAESEFYFQEMSTRKNAIEVPGAEYYLRSQALKSLRNAGHASHLKLAFYFYKLANFLNFPIYSNFIGLKLYNLLFQKRLFETQIAYTARGGFGIPIRKFFEIPAAGALLACTPPIGFDALGFQDGVTHIECAPQALPELIADYAIRREFYSAVARSGQKHVLQKHSLFARASQVRACLNALVSGQYAGARWVAGDYQVQVNP